MIKIFVKNKAIIHGLEKKHIDYISNLFIIQNPIFQKKKQLNLSLWGVSRFLSYFKIKNKSIEIPIGGLPNVLNYLSSVIDSKLIKIIDLRTTRSDKTFFSKYNFIGKLLDYQQDIIDNLNDKTIGIISSNTGSGKTITFINSIFQKKVNTLILVNTIELANQTINSILKFTNIPSKDYIGLIGSGKFSIKPITIATHQTLYKLPKVKQKYISKFFGMIIADEVHIVAAKTYYNNMTNLSAKYKFGYSATPEREDGLTKVIYWATGPLISKVDNKKLFGKNTVRKLIIPKLIIQYTDYFFPLIDTSDYMYMMQDLSTNEDRNDLIVNYIIKKFSHEIFYVCILCNYIDQVNILATKLGDEAIALTSKTPKKKRIQIMEDIRNKKVKYIVSTYSLFGTGIDVPHLNVMVFAAPKRSKRLIKQSIGRIVRSHPGKSFALIVDFVDKKIGLLKNQAKVRHTIINKSYK